MVEGEFGGVTNPIIISGYNPDNNLHQFELYQNSSSENQIAHVVNGVAEWTTVSYLLQVGNPLSTYINETFDISPYSALEFFGGARRANLPSEWTEI